MTSGGEMAGVELVCRLMAATPPYLYNPNGPPHCFFFSDLLRGLVAKRCATSPPAEDPVSSKRIRLASIGSAFSAKTGSRDEERAREEHRSSNPLSPSSFLPRLDVLYRKLHEVEREATSTTDRPTDPRPTDRPTEPRPTDRPTDTRPTDRHEPHVLGDDAPPNRPADRQTLPPTDRHTDNASPYPPVKHEAEIPKMHLT